MSDTDLIDDDIDRAWRAGLVGLIPAEDADPIARIEGHLRKRQRVRIAARGVTAAALIALVVGVIFFAARPHRVGVTNATVPTRVVVEDGQDNTLSIYFPGHETFGSSGPQFVVVPAGPVRFIVHMTSSHALRIKGVAGFLVERPPASHGTATIVRTVRLAPGHYELYCSVPGHETAGEVAGITVR